MHFVHVGRQLINYLSELVTKEEIKMVKTIATIDGMMCGMCESHINDTIRKNFKINKVSSSHSKGRTEIISDEPLDGEKLKEAIKETGYMLVSVETQPYEKKKFSLFSRKK